jgi:hypothetical protein
MMEWLELMNNELERMWKEAAVAQRELLSRHKTTPIFMPD